MLFFILLFPFSFILTISVVGHQSIDARYAMHGFPLVSLYIGAGVDSLFAWLQSRRKERLSTLP